MPRKGKVVRWGDAGSDLISGDRPSGFNAGQPPKFSIMRIREPAKDAAPEETEATAAELACDSADDAGETEALAFACTWFHHWREYRDAGGHPLARHSPLTVDAGRALARFAFSLGATASTVQARLHVVAAARMGEPEAMAAIEQIILELQSRGAQMPVEFAAYDMDRKAGLLRPHRSSGPKLRDRLMRNTFIALAVEALCDRFDLMPTRKHRGGQPSARRSASSIAAEAYSREAGQGQSAKKGSRKSGSKVAV